MLALKQFFGALAILFHILGIHPALATSAPEVKKPSCTSTTWRKTLNPAESWIIAHEHGERFLSRVTDYKATHDPNPSSTAFGIGQLLWGTREQYYREGTPLDTTLPCSQLDGMRTYIKDRYGDSWAAYNFWQEHRWY